MATKKTKTEGKKNVTKTKLAEAAVPTAKPDQPEVIDISVDPTDPSLDKRVFEGAPKSCFGRKFDARPGSSCMGRKGASKACAVVGECRKLIIARFEAGISDPEDFRIPGSYEVPAEFKAAEAKPEAEKGPAPKAKAKPKAKKEKAEKLKPEPKKEEPKPEPKKVEEKAPSTAVIPAATTAPTQIPTIDLVAAEQTTITKEELDKAEARIMEIERKQVAGSIGYRIDLGREWAHVYRNMKGAEFDAWVSRLDRTRSTVHRNMKFAAVVDALGKGAKDKILQSPKLTLQKFEIMLDTVGPEYLLAAFQSEAEDARGTKRLLSELPCKQMKEAAKVFVHGHDAKDTIDGMLKKAEQRDSARRDGTPPPAPVIETTATKVDKATGEVLEVGATVTPPAPANVTPDEVKPLNPMPYLINLVSMKRQWTAGAQAKVMAQNIGALSAKEIRMLNEHRLFLRDILLPDIETILGQVEG